MKDIKAKDFDKAFDAGEDVSKYLDTTKINTKIKRVNIDFPTWVIEGLDSESKRLGVTRQSLVKMWIAERLDQKDKEAA